MKKTTRRNASHFAHHLLYIAVFFLFAACTGQSVPSSPTPPLATITAVTLPTRNAATEPTATNAPTATTAPTTAPTLTTAPSATTAPTATTVPSATALPSATPAAALIPPTGPLSGAALLEALRGGGYIIYFRHAATDPTPDDANPVVLSDCSTQRNLSEAGRAQAREIGQQFQRLGIPVGQVRASPFCRAMDTLRLAFGRVEIEPTLENLETSANDAERESRTEGLRRLLATPPEPGTNTTLAAHGFNISAAAQVSIPEGGAAIFRPDGAGGFEQIATVRWDEWAALEQ